jgi:formylglycine-generating enzyme required for sulfatase activity
MGCNEEVDSECDGDEKPGRNVQVAAFQIDKTEVTVAAYRECVEAGSCSRPATDRAACTWDQSGKEQHPINCVDWEQAKAYCQWADKRLPSETEWEKAARGTDRWKYPWGNQGYKTAKRVANIADETSGLQWKIDGYDDGHSETAPVGSYLDGASPYGALDMVGNVYEWTSDWYDSERTYRSVRGGSWDSFPWRARASYRFGFTPAERYNLGFRCAQ